MADKTTTLEEAVAHVRDGMTVGIGGWGSRRKPMAFVRALVRSGVKDLTIVSYGGPDVGILCATGQAKKVVYGFVSLDSIPLEPHYRAARQNATIEATELDEGMLLLGLQAAAWRVPFLPTRAGMGSDLLALQPEFRMVRSPYPSHGAAADAEHRRVRDQVHRVLGDAELGLEAGLTGAGEGRQLGPGAAAAREQDGRAGEADDHDQAAQPQATAGLAVADPCEQEAHRRDQQERSHGAAGQREQDGDALDGDRAESDQGPLAGAGEAVRVAGVLGLEAVVHGQGAGAEDAEQEQAGLMVGVDEGGEQRGGEGGVDVAGLIKAVDLAHAEAGLDQAQEGDDGPGAGGADFTEIPGDHRRDDKDEPGAVGGVFQGGNHQRIT